ncbi:S27A2 synthetase, partial [Todus mexicanus]|nr:S27A2 synthetase [Todus mexicanus]
RRFNRRPPLTLLEVFRGHVDRWPLRPLLLFQEDLYTYGDAERFSNRLARVLRRRLGDGAGAGAGAGGGDGDSRRVTVAVLLPNQPNYVWSWLALAKLGWPMACVNYNARGRALTHALRSAGAVGLLVSPGEWGNGGCGGVYACVKG